MTLTVYTFEDRDGNENGFHTQDYEEARRYAREWKLAVIANEFEWTDSMMVDDFRPITRRKKQA